MNRLVSHILVQVEHLLSPHKTLHVCFVVAFHPPSSSFSELLVLINLLFALLPTCKSWDEIIFIDVSHRLTQPQKRPPVSLSLPPCYCRQQCHLIPFINYLLRARTIFFKVIVKKEGEGKKSLSTPGVSYTECKEKEMCCQIIQNKKMEYVALLVSFPQLSHAVTYLEVLSVCVRLGRIK